MILELEHIDSDLVTKEDKSFDLINRFLLKRNKQRQEFVTLVLHITRMVMLFSRIFPSTPYAVNGVTFALLGFFEAVIGIVRLFNFKKQLVKVGSYSSAK